MGNLSVGGTGKTPMVEYLIRLLKPTYALATLSRGYKRKTKGTLIASESSTVHELGDEPFQYQTKYGEDVIVAVGEERSLAVPKILMEHPETQVILLDDAYQHRTIDPDLNILLTQFNKPFYNDYVLPSGMLRELRRGARRADVVVVTKCPEDITASQKADCIEKIEKYTLEDVPVFFTNIHYGLPISLHEGGLFSGKVILFAGLATMEPLNEYVEDAFKLIESVSFKDHHDYSEDEIEVLVKKAEEANATLLTTEKDITKLRSGNYLSRLEKVGIFYLPISVQFLFNEGKQFDSLVKEAIIEKYDQEEESYEVEEE